MTLLRSARSDYFNFQGLAFKLREWRGAVNLVSPGETNRILSMHGVCTMVCVLSSAGST